MSFKVGDIVKMTIDDPPRVYAGDTGIVIEIEKTTKQRFFYVNFDIYTHVRYFKGERYYTMTDKLELVNERKNGI